MAVIRDVNLDTTSDNIIFIGTIGGLCLIFAVLGIKLRWFKHRMTFNDLPTTSEPSTQSNGMEPQIIRATFRPSSEFDNYVEVTPPKVLPPVRIHKSARNAISLPPRKRQAPEVPALRISHTNDTNESEPLQDGTSSEQVVNSLIVEERRKSTPPPPLPVSPPPIDHEERLLLSLEADYPYTESETIKIKKVHVNNESILPSPPPYQESDPLAHIHFKKFTKKKSSSTPLPPTQNAVPVTLDHTDNDLANNQLRKSSFDASPSPKENKLDKRFSFLNQVPTPTEIPKLAFDFPFVSTSSLNDNGPAPSNQTIVLKPEPMVKSSQSNQSLETSQPKSNEKKSLLEYFGLKMGSKVENDVNKSKNENNGSPVAPKNEKKVAPVEKLKVKKIRVLKVDKKENVPKIKVAKNEGVSIDARANIIKSTDNTRQPEKNVMVAQQNVLDAPNEEIMENRMEIDYFQKVKKSKTNRVPIIVKSPKPEMKFEEKPPKNGVFRHEIDFSAANGPLKVKKKKAKSATEDAALSYAIKPVVNGHNDINQNIASSSTNANVDVPIPKPRAILKLDGFDDNNRDMETDKKPKKKVVIPALSSPSSPSDTEDAWNLVAKHRLNTRAITATAISVRQKSDSDETTNSSLLQTKQLEMLNKPKTMREMKREQEQRNENVFNFRGSEDKESDTEA